MKKEKSVEREQNKTQNLNKLENSESNSSKIMEEKHAESLSSRIKKEGDLTNSLPLSFEIPNKEYSSHIKDNPIENSNFHQETLVPNNNFILSNLQPSNFSAFDRSSSPFVVDVHKLSFNNMEFNFPPGRALLFNTNK
jgi:hypothetical protein